MDKMTLAESYALNLYLSDYVSNYAEIMEAFYNEKIPDDVIIWYWFEDWHLPELAENIEALKNDFLEFAERVKNENL